MEADALKMSIEMINAGHAFRTVFFFHKDHLRIKKQKPQIFFNFHGLERGLSS